MGKTASKMSFRAPENVVLKPMITVFGVGGAGNNAVNNMIVSGLQGANFVVANTDAQSLEISQCENKIQLGVNLTKGLGAGASPQIGAEAAEESENEIKAMLEGSNMVFITAGMGGGTGSGSSPVVARIAKELGILTVGVVTTPFQFEGFHRKRIADGALVELQKRVDTLIVIPNQNLFRVANEKTTFGDAFKMADEVLHAGVRSITDLMIMPGLINLDFADIKSVMSEMGKAMMGTGEASGENRAIRAAEDAISNPLLDQTSMRGANGLLINISGGRDMTLLEVDTAATRITEELGDNKNANIIFGSTLNPDLEGIIRVSVVATGINAQSHNTTNDSIEKTVNQLNPDAQDEVTSQNETLNQINNLNHNNELEEHNLSHSFISNNITEINDENKYINKPQIIHTIASRSPVNQVLAKPSLFSKVWNSLKSSDKIVNNPEPISDVMHDHRSTDVSDIPAILRKPKDK